MESLAQDVPRSAQEPRAVPGGPATRPPAGAGGTSLAALIAELDREGPLEEVLRPALARLVDATGFDTAAVFAVGPGPDARLVSVTGPTRRRGYPYADLTLGDGRVAEALTRGVALVGYERRARELPGALLDVCPRGPGLAMLAPARRASVLHGVLVLAGRDRRAPAEEALSLVETFAHFLGLSLANAVLLERSYLSEAVLDTAGAVARAVSGSLDLHQTFHQVAVSAARVMADSRCLLLELEAESGDLVAVASSDPADEALVAMHVQLEDRLEAGLEVGTAGGFLVEDLVWGARTPEVVRARLTARSGLFVPIRSESGSIGSLLLLSQGRRDTYSDADVGVAESLAEQAASAICNARLFRDLERSEHRAQALLQRISDLRGRQRTELAGVIHDDIVQTVVAALFELQSLLAEIPEEQAEPVSRACDLLRETIARARQMIRELRPPVLDGLGLAGALRALVDQASSPGPPDIRFDLDETSAFDDLSPTTSTAVYLVAREAVRNALRHAGARSITVGLAAVPATAGDTRRVRLEVADDGRGFDPAEGAGDDHFGVRMMEEQMALAGGSFSVTRAPGGTGTLIAATAPWGGPP